MGMLQIGSVAFTTTGPHYDKLKHAMKADWARQKRFGRRDALQFTGLGEESVTVTGTIYTDYFNGFDALATLRSQMPRPQMVVSGAGDVFGLWCIIEVGNEQTYQDSSGAPRKITFDVKLEAFGEDGLGAGFLGIDIGSAASALIARLW
jgi:phage protein U